MSANLLSADPYHWLQTSLATIHQANWYRRVRMIHGLSGAEVTLDGQRVVNFASNDYLGLAGDPRLIAAAVAATQAYGTGSTGSRLVTGHRPLHQQLEQAIASLKQTDDALVFSSGYLANVGTIAALVGKRDLILADQYNHSSLKIGAQVSGATVMNYAHLAMAELRQQLQQHRQHYRRCLILTDTVFSMDGDICPLPELLAIAADFACMVLVDEAHGTGVFGDTGAGAVEHLGCTGQPLIQMGTLSKAIGSLGGYVAATAPVIDFLRNRAATWIYTTGLSPADTAAALEGVRVIQTESQRRSQLWRNVQQLQTALRDRVAATDYTCLPSQSPICCLQLPSAERALAVGQALLKAGLYAPAIRPPTVPTSRLRITLMATHTPQQIEQLVDGLVHSLEVPIDTNA